MSDHPIMRDAEQPLVSPQNTGDLERPSGSRQAAYVVSPLRDDLQSQREVDLSYPEVYLGPPEERSPKVVDFRDGSDAPEVVPANDPGYYADEKYMPPRWYRNDQDSTPVEHKKGENVSSGDGAVAVGTVPTHETSAFDAESQTRVEVNRAQERRIESRRKRWIWIAIAVAVIGIITLAVGLGIGLGMKGSSNDNSSPSTTSSTSLTNSSTQPSSAASSATSTTSLTRTASSATPTSTTLTCPASNSTTYKTNRKSFSIECGIDHPGGNIETIDADNLTFCIDSCAESDQCAGSTFLGAACYLKGTWSDPVYSNSEVAGGRLVD